MPVAHIYVATGFEEIELVTIVDILRRAKIDTLMVSLNDELSVVGAHYIGINTDVSFIKAGDEIPDIIILPGGGPGTQALLAHGGLHARLQQQIDAKKRVAAICAAPMVLAKVGLLAGKNACCYPGCEETLTEGGAKISMENVVIDGLITTSRDPATAMQFALSIVAQLIGQANADEITHGLGCG